MTSLLPAAPGRHAARTRAMVLVLLAVLAGGAVRSADAQTPATTATRVELEARIAEIDAAIAREDDRDDRRRLEAERAAVRDRLTAGDFRVGDRLVLIVRGDTAVADTFTVRDGQYLRLPGMEDIPLRGVLRSELDAHLGRQLRRFIREPEFVATPLVRVGVLGQVAQPGFYSFEADAPVSDVIMRAGGPSPNADLGKTKIMRGDDALLRGDEARDAIAQGRTLDQLNMRAGDSIFIEERRRRDWLQTAQTGLWIIGGVLSIYGGSRLF